MPNMVLYKYLLFFFPLTPGWLSSSQTQFLMHFHRSFFTSPSLNRFASYPCHSRPSYFLHLIPYVATVSISDWLAPVHSYVSLQHISCFPIEYHRITPFYFLFISFPVLTTGCLRTSVLNQILLTSAKFAFCHFL